METVLDGYIECALWSSHGMEGDGVEYLDAKYGKDDLAPETVATMTEEINAFVAANAADLMGMTNGQIGHDIWLTRNAHGAGFWDRGLGARGERLTQAANALGEQNLYVGDDGKLYLG